MSDSRSSIDSTQRVVSNREFILCSTTANNTFKNVLRGGSDNVNKYKIFNIFRMFIKNIKRFLLEKNNLELKPIQETFLMIIINLQVIIQVVNLNRIILKEI